MPATNPFPDDPDPEAGTTSRTLFQQAHLRGREGDDARVELARRYFGPTLSCFRRFWGADARERAIDFVTGFFVVPNADGTYRFEKFAPDGPGRFRSYVYTAARNSSADDLKARRKQKPAVSFPVNPWDEEPEAAPADAATDPEVLWDRAWATELLARAIAEVRHAWVHHPRWSQHPRLFEALLAHIERSAERVPYDELEREFGIANGILRVRRTTLGEEIRAAIYAQLRAEGYPETGLDDGHRELFRLLDP
ncbi:hypothetical protein [Frigoriglobus tundricola]|uniref:Uncharacterized protein n=1 Tax=Frigoriglobus tundricola TaxID=2774151 RepID=A0A6M5YNC8_9BACT|nr:hypothetical protein [Frigoriglobus tundricola]QJW95475.1 hypothetical protein FTUN_3024 [Frigoriglobus tundricola]